MGLASQRTLLQIGKHRFHDIGIGEQLAHPVSTFQWLDVGFRRFDPALQFILMGDLL
jgi:hypothetical protein